MMHGCMPACMHVCTSSHRCGGWIGLDWMALRRSRHTRTMRLCMYVRTSSQVWISYADRLEQPGDIFKVRVVWCGLFHAVAPMIRLMARTNTTDRTPTPTPPTQNKKINSTCTSGASGRSWRSSGAPGPLWRRRPATTRWPTGSTPRYGREGGFSSENGLDVRTHTYGYDIYIHISHPPSNPPSLNTHTYTHTYLTQSPHPIPPPFISQHTGYRGASRPFRAAGGAAAALPAAHVPPLAAAAGGGGGRPPRDRGRWVRLYILYIYIYIFI